MLIVSVPLGCKYLKSATFALTPFSDLGVHTAFSQKFPEIG